MKQDCVLDKKGRLELYWAVDGGGYVLICTKHGHRMRIIPREPEPAARKEG